MKIAVINSSGSVYNYATHKMLFKFMREGHEVFFSTWEIEKPNKKARRRNRLGADLWALQVDKAYLSVIFTSDIPKMIQDVQNLRAAGVEVEIGGPAATAMPQYIMDRTGITPHISLDDRFEHVPGNQYRIVFTSRGCIRRCPWCIVQDVEPNRVEYDDFPIPIGPKPCLGDNCILATSWEHQKLVVERLKNVRALDINSGFDCRLFTEDHYQLYSQLHFSSEGWRLAFDSMNVERDFERAVSILKKHNVGYRQINVYVLFGFPGTTFEESVYRFEKVRALGCSPYPQRYMPLDSVDARNYVAPGYTKQQLDDLRQYWSNAYAWRTCSFEEFKQNYKPAKSKHWRTVKWKDFK